MPPPTPSSTSSTVPPKVAGGPTLPTNVSPSLVETIVKRPCTLLTEAEADAAAGAHFVTQFDLAATGLCEYTANPPGNSTINVYVQRGTVGEDLPPKFANTFIPEPALGRGVIWVVEKGERERLWRAVVPSWPSRLGQLQRAGQCGPGRVTRSLDHRSGLLFAHVTSSRPDPNNDQMEGTFL